MQVTQATSNPMPRDLSTLNLNHEYLIRIYITGGVTLGWCPP